MSNPTDTENTLMDESPLKAVEIKFAVRLDLTDAARAAYPELNGEPKHRRMIRFYDTGTLALQGKGTILRSRVPHKKDKPGDSTVKVRGELALSIGDDLLPIDAARGEGKREGDWVLIDKADMQPPLQPSISITMKETREKIQAGDAASDPLGSPIAAVFEPEQVELVKEALGHEPPWDQLRVIGPISATIWEISGSTWNPTAEIEDELTAEFWEMEGLSVMEFSCKVKPERADAMASQLRAALQEKKLRSLGQSKTALVLNHLLGHPVQ